MRNFIRSVLYTAIFSILTISPAISQTPKPLEEPASPDLPTPTELNRQISFTFFNPVTKRAVRMMPFSSQENFISDRQNGIMYIGRIDYNLIQLVAMEAEAYKILGHNKIIIDLHSPGGSLHTLRILNIQIELLKREGFTIETRVGANQGCMSACTVLFLQGDIRTVHKDSIWMFHSPHIMFNRELTKAEEIFYYFELMRERIKFAKYYDNACGPESIIHQGIMDKKDHYYFQNSVELACTNYFTNVTEDDDLIPESNNIVTGRQLLEEDQEPKENTCDSIR